MVKFKLKKIDIGRYLYGDDDFTSSYSFLIRYENKKYRIRCGHYMYFKSLKDVKRFIRKKKFITKANGYNT